MLSWQECREAARSLGMKFHRSHRSTLNPAGCHTFYHPHFKGVIFNENVDPSTTINADFRDLREGGVCRTEGKFLFLIIISSHIYISQLNKCGVAIVVINISKYGISGSTTPLKLQRSTRIVFADRIVSRIVPGDNTTILRPPHSHPWTVGLVGNLCNPIKHSYETRIFCGGTLIGPKHVITAAHCLGSQIKNGQFEYRGNILYVVVGEHDQTVNDGQENVRLKEDPIVHPNWTSLHPTLHPYDVAILLLEKEVTNQYSKAALLPQPYENFKTLNVSGWGTMGGYKDFSGVLRTVRLDVISPGDNLWSKCHRKESKFESFICGESLQDFSRGTDGGDSGGKR